MPVVQTITTLQKKKFKHTYNNSLHKVAQYFTKFSAMPKPISQKDKYKILKLPK